MRPLYILIGALLVIASLVLVFVYVFKPGKTTTKTVTSAVVLADHANETNSVSYMVDGFTTSGEAHRAIKITITNQSRTLEVIGGYSGKVILSKTYTNDVASYKAFLAGLQTSGYIKQNAKYTSLAYEGRCPLGYRFVMNTAGIKDAPTLLWTTSCSNKVGSFQGNLGSVKQLFKNQIPDYQKLIKGVKLS
jgi:hypothetical protein